MAELKEIILCSNSPIWKPKRSVNTKKENNPLKWSLDTIAEKSLLRRKRNILDSEFIRVQGNLRCFYLEISAWILSQINLTFHKKLWQENTSTEEVRGAWHGGTGVQARETELRRTGTEKNGLFRASRLLFLPPVVIFSWIPNIFSPLSVFPS